MKFSLASLKMLQAKFHRDQFSVLMTLKTEFCGDAYVMIIAWYARPTRAYRRVWIRQEWIKMEIVKIIKSDNI